MTIANGEIGSSVRAKLNQSFADIATLSASLSSQSSSLSSVSSRTTSLEIRAAKSIANVATLLADAALTYAAGSTNSVAAGDIIQTRAEGFSYEVAASGASDHHVTTAGGMKLYILPNGAGEIEWGATGAVSGASNHGTQWTVAGAALSRAGTKVLRVGPGTWRFQYVTMPEGIVVKCAKWLTVFKPVSIDDRAIFTMDSGSAVSFIDGCTFEDATFEGGEVTPTFSEQQHLITIHGVDGASFIGCTFKGWRGDALYLGSSDSGGTTERHNRNVQVLRCYFDGVNNENRQAISVIDVDGLCVRDNVFVNCTKSTMPGVIDLEPNTNAFHVIRNVWIDGNSFENCGGNVGTVAIFIPAVVSLPKNINILNNKARSLALSSGGGFFGCIVNRVTTDTDADMAVLVEGNDVRSLVGRPYQIISGKGIRARRNVFSDASLASIVSFNTALAYARDVAIADTFIRCGSGESQGMSVFSADYVDLTGSIFDDCANGGAGACAIRFNTGTSSYVKLNDIKIVSPTGKTLRAVQKEAGHTFTPDTNQHYGCQWGTLVNAFEAHQSDSLWTVYTPVAEGATSAGSGTYTRQYGRWRRIGKQVFFELEIVQSSHTGTGLLELSLPVQADASSNNELRPIAVMLDGVSTTGGQIGAINPGATAGGVTGCIRCYHTATGAIAQTVIPAGAATFRASGTYMME